MRTSFCVPVHIFDEKSLELTRNAVASFRVADPDSEVIIVDNGSPMGAGALRELADVYVRFKDNRGFCIAMNTARKIARGMYVALCNNDIRIAPNAIDVCAAILDDDPDIKTVHPRMTNYDEPFQYGDLVASKGRELWCTGSFIVMSGHDQTRFLYDEMFIHGFDDLDLELKIRDNGFFTAYTNKTCYQHHHSYTAKGVLKEYWDGLRGAQEYFTRKWGMSPDEVYTTRYPNQLSRRFADGSNFGIDDWVDLSVT